MVQRQSTRCIFSDHRMCSTTEMMKTLGWESLAEQQWQAKAIVMFRICINIIDISVSLFTPVAHYGHCSQDSFLIPHCRTEKFKDSFIPTGTKIWNSLKIEERSCKSLAAFRRKLFKEN